MQLDFYWPGPNKQSLMDRTIFLRAKVFQPEKLNARPGLAEMNEA
jgi:hypothetical protein